jgi:hypothetical protein
MPKKLMPTTKNVFVPLTSMHADRTAAYVGESGGNKTKRVSRKPYTKYLGRGEGRNHIENVR